MKLFFSPGACSLSPHIVLREAGLPFELEQVDVRAKKTKGGSDFLQINPKGQVPVLALDDGEFLTEGPAIVQYLADKVPASRLVPAAGTKERYRVQEWLNFITSELHKNFSPLFRPNTPDAYKPVAKENLAGRFAYLDRQLANRKYLMDQVPVDRSRPMAQPQGLRRSRCGTPEGSGGDASGRPAKGRVKMRRSWHAALRPHAAFVPRAYRTRGTFRRRRRASSPCAERANAATCRSAIFIRTVRIDTGAAVRLRSVRYGVSSAQREK